MKLFPGVLAVVFLSSIATAAQDAKPATPPRTVVIDIDVLDLTLDHPSDLEKAISDRRVLGRLVADGKARPVAELQVRSRTNESTSARIGQRVPIQASSAVQSTGQTQIQYENTGLSVDVQPRLVEAGRLEIRLKIDLSTVVRNENILAPTFVQRTVNDVVMLKPGDPTVLISVQQHVGLLPALPRTGSKQADTGGENFVIVLTARLVD